MIYLQFLCDSNSGRPNLFFPRSFNSMLVLLISSMHQKSMRMLQISDTEVIPAFLSHTSYRVNTTGHVSYCRNKGCYYAAWVFFIALSLIVRPIPYSYRRKLVKQVLFQKMALTQVFALVLNSCNSLVNNGLSNS